RNLRALCQCGDGTEGGDRIVPGDMGRELALRAGQVAEARPDLLFDGPCSTRHARLLSRGQASPRRARNDCNRNLRQENILTETEAANEPCSNESGGKQDDGGGATVRS